MPPRTKPKNDRRGKSPNTSRNASHLPKGDNDSRFYLTRRPELVAKIKDLYFEKGWPAQAVVDAIGDPKVTVGTIYGHASRMRKQQRKAEAEAARARGEVPVTDRPDVVPVDETGTSLVELPDTPNQVIERARAFLSSATRDTQDIANSVIKRTRTAAESEHTDAKELSTLLQAADRSVRLVRTTSGIEDEVKTKGADSGSKHLHLHMAPGSGFGP